MNNRSIPARQQKSLVGLNERQTRVYKGLQAHRRITLTRKPTQPERAAARSASREIKTAIVKGTRLTDYNSQHGPGRFRTEEAVRSLVSRKAGTRAHGLKPFIKTRRLPMPDTPVSLGVVIDMSASMEGLAKIAHSLRWMATEATHEAGGKVAVAGWSAGHAWPLQAPDERDRLIRQPECEAGHHAFTASWWLVNQALNLMDGDGARTLLVFTDWWLDGSEVAAARKILVDCERAGVGVVSVVDDIGSATRFVPEANMGAARMIEAPSHGDHPEKAAIELMPLLAESIREAAERVAS